MLPNRVHVLHIIIIISTCHISRDIITRSLSTWSSTYNPMFFSYILRRNVWANSPTYITKHNRMSRCNGPENKPKAMTYNPYTSPSHRSCHLIQQSQMQSETQFNLKLINGIPQKICIIKPRYPEYLAMKIHPERSCITTISISSTHTPQRTPIYVGYISCITYTQNKTMH